MRFLFLLLSLLVLTFALEEPQKKTEQMLKDKIESLKEFAELLREKYGIEEEDRLKLCSKIRAKIYELATPEFVKRGYIVFPNSEYAYKILPNCDVIKERFSASLSTSAQEILESAQELSQIEEREEQEVRMDNLFILISYFLLAFTVVYILLKFLTAVLYGAVREAAIYFLLLILVGGAGWALITLL